MYSSSGCTNTPSRKFEIRFAEQEGARHKAHAVHSVAGPRRPRLAAHVPPLHGARARGEEGESRSGHRALQRWNRPHRRPRANGDGAVPHGGQRADLSFGHRQADEAATGNDDSECCECLFFFMIFAFFCLYLSRF